MLGCYDFCGHYDWTFAWIQSRYGKAALERFWEQAIAFDSQKHALETIRELGFKGMNKYWAHTLAEESPDQGYQCIEDEDSFSIVMTDCPSRGFLLRNNIKFSCDYCDHCIGWIGPVMKASGFSVLHAHNHKGQCHWEFKEDTASATAPYDYKEHPPFTSLETETAGGKECVDVFVLKQDSLAKTRHIVDRDDLNA